MNHFLNDNKIFVETWIFKGSQINKAQRSYHHWNQRTQLPFPAGFGRVLILKSMKNRFFSDFRLFVGLDFITIEISEVFYP